MKLAVEPSKPKGLLRRYSIEDLVEIQVAVGTPEPIVDGVDFQLSGLGPAPPGSAAKRVLMVGPYDSARFEGIANTRFHRARFRHGQAFVLPDDRFGVIRRKDGYEIYADEPMFVINPFIHALLLEQKALLVHAAAILEEDGTATLLPGPGGVGKTAAVGVLMERKGRRFLGDDVVVLTHDARVTSFPRRLVLKPGHDVVYGGAPGASKRRLAVRDRVRRAIIANMPFTGVAKPLLDAVGLRKRASAWANGPPQFVTRSPNDVWPGRVGESGRLSKIVFLERHLEEGLALLPLDNHSLVRRMFSIMWHEWEGHMRLWFALSATGLLDSAAAFKRMESVVREATSRIDASLLQIPEGAPPADVARMIESDTSARERT